MNIIESNACNEIVIKNSKFICLLYKVNNEDEINELLRECALKYKDYTHLTFAWRLINKQKYSDDGEPGGTAGAPIMEVLLKNDIVNVLAVVIRYFGGVKLGAGGLIRAYSKSCRETLSLTTLQEYILYNYYELISSYDDLKLLNTLTNGFDIVKKDFGENIVYNIKVENDKDNIRKIFKNTDIKINEI